MNKFPEKGLFEFRHHAPHLGIFAQYLDPIEDLSQQSLTHVRHTLLPVPRQNSLQVGQRGFGKRNGCDEHLGS